MRERKCVICGAALPASAAAAKKYCDACKEAHEIEYANRIREERHRIRVEAKSTPRPEKKPPRTLKKKDEAYCKSCMYKGRFSAGYLCDYYSMTGRRRGCPAGYGCERRLTAPKGNGKRVCERCGVEIESRYSRFCADCRMAFHREAARHMVDIMRERRREKGRD